MTSLRPARPSDLDTVVRWIHSQEECDRWTGGSVRYPVDRRRLLDDLGWRISTNWVLERHAGVVGFGQYRAEPNRRQHLARIIVDPACRGAGLGRILVSGLVNSALDTDPRCLSLNVHPGNATARSLYGSLGFREVDDLVENRNGRFVYMERLPGI